MRTICTDGLATMNAKVNHVESLVPHVLFSYTNYTHFYWLLHVIFPDMSTIYLSFMLNFIPTSVYDRCLTLSTTMAPALVWSSKVTEQCLVAVQMDRRFLLVPRWTKMYHS